MEDAYHRYTDTTKLHSGLSQSGTVAALLAPGSRIRQLVLPQELKEQYRNASVLSQKRVVFNIHGNHYRLVVDIEYRLKIVFLVWFGSHEEYDKIDARRIGNDRTNQK